MYIGFDLLGAVMLALVLYLCLRKRKEQQAGEDVQAGRGQTRLRQQQGDDHHPDHAAQVALLAADVGRAELGGGRNTVRAVDVAGGAKAVGHGLYHDVGSGGQGTPVRGPAQVPRGAAGPRPVRQLVQGGGAGRRGAGGEAGQERGGGRGRVPAPEGAGRPRQAPRRAATAGLLLRQKLVLYEFQALARYVTNPPLDFLCSHLIEAVRSGISGRNSADEKESGNAPRGPRYGPNEPNRLLPRSRTRTTRCRPILFFGGGGES
jgi:hypothetical protein